MNTPDKMSELMGQLCRLEKEAIHTITHRMRETLQDALESYTVMCGNMLRGMKVIGEMILYLFKMMLLVSLTCNGIIP